MRTRHLFSTAALLCLFCLMVPSLSARVNIKPGFNAFSPQQDMEMGQQAAQQVSRQFQLVTDPQLNDYINRLGKRLASFAPGYKFPYQFSMVNAKQINAFAIPGGHVYVHTATVAAAADEAQLAGVLAHEISHVALRHSTNQASKALLAQAPLAILGGIFSGGLGQLAQLGISFGINSVFLKFSRTAESQADELGSQIMYDAGYDPRAMAQFFETIQKQGGNQSVEFLSDHPNPGNRIKDVDRLIPNLGPSKNLAEDSPEFQQIRRRVEGLKASAPQGNPATTGRLQEPPEPSRRVQKFDAGFFIVQYPDNWQANGQGNGEVTIVPPGALITTESGQPEIAYGVISSIFQLEDTGRQMSLSQATDELIAQLQQSNPHLHLISRSDRNARIDGQNAYSVQALSQSPIGSESEMDWIVTSFQPDGLWYMIFIAPEHAWNRYEPVYQQMVSSVRFPR